MKENTKISVITVCYNAEKYIRIAIESVLRQTYKNYEYVIIDGGSSDGTLKIIKNYYKLFEGKLSYVSEKDNGIYDAMNKGLSMITGDIVGILNSDDYYEDKAFEIVEKNYLNDANGIISGLMRRVDNNGDIVFTKGHYSYSEFLWRINITMPISHPAMFVPKSVYDKIGVFRTDMYILSDYELLLRIVNNGYKIYFVDDILTNFREGGVSDGKLIIRTKESFIARSSYYNIFNNLFFTTCFFVVNGRGILYKKIFKK